MRLRRLNGQPCKRSDKKVAASSSKQRLLVLAWGAILMTALVGLPESSFGEIKRSNGQAIYLSVIPQAQSDQKKKRSYLGFFMTVRNTSMRHPATIVSITYHNASGEVEKEILTKPLTLAPLSSHAIGFKKKELAVQEEMTGCMIIRWEASEKINPVLAEGIVIGAGTGWTSGMVFKGVVIEEL